QLNQEGISTEIISLGANAPKGCSACYRCFESQNQACSMTNDAMNELIGKMLSADGIILASPTYFADVSAGMKALIERAGMVARANKNMFRHKVGAGIVAVRRGGAIHTFDSMNHFFLISEMIVVGSIYWNLGIGRTPGEVMTDEEGIRTMANLGQNMAWAMKRLVE
ncbi:MAG: flavodoxin family protein, partial [Candidatus Margulisiibacteriota bacterium]